LSAVLHRATIKNKQKTELWTGQVAENHVYQVQTMR